MWGIVALSPRYPAWIIEQAAAAALLRQVCSYKAVRALAEQLLAAAIARLDAQQPELALLDGASPLTQQHELIRPSTEYAEFFNRSTGSQLPIEPSGETPS